jgi:threonyl-tRNA synthetase
VSQENFDDAMSIGNMVQSVGVRSSIDRRHAVLGEKVHAAVLERVPYIAIIGGREKQQGVIAVRSRDQFSAERKITVQAFMEELREQQANKRSFG